MPNAATPKTMPSWRVRLLLATAAAATALASMAPLATSAAAPRVLPPCGGETFTAEIATAVPARDADSLGPPAITADAAVAIDAETGRVLFGLNEHQPRPPASTTKIMTAILALENADENLETISETDATRMPGSSVMGLRPGVHITMRDLLYGLMLPSGNDAAIEIARSVDGGVPAFVKRMNAKARQLKLKDTQFKNPHGLDARGHYSSAYDLAMLGRYAMGNPQFREIAAARAHQLPPPSDYMLTNGNTLLGTYDGAEGIKIGWTDDAGWTFVASAVRDGRRVLVAVLHSDDRDGDAAALLDWVYATHTWTEISPRTARTLELVRRVAGPSSVARSLMVCG